MMKSLNNNKIQNYTILPALFILAVFMFNNAYAYSNDYSDDTIIVSNNHRVKPLSSQQFLHSDTNSSKIYIQQETRGLLKASKFEASNTVSAKQAQETETNRLKTRGDLTHIISN